MIIASIDLRKIDQSKCKTHTNGAKYCDIVLIESKQNQYGNDYMVVQGLPKEDRLAGKKGAILGNAKIFESRQSDQPRKPITTAPNTPARNENSPPPESDDGPF